ncbi:unnamed protein product [Prorocentrum cordatum]|uniref:Nodulin-like domain-containing protein n=1 Tax=Prorocentrum cordatum TaxID=2364126 RepID=A0ABN9RFC9_9DINO|nr:unnamed protein product [Polarella glacialis]
MRDRTASVVLGLPLFTVRRALLLSVCILGVVQYGLTTVFGVIAGDLEPYYGLTPEQGDELYAWMNFGSCALSFIPGLCYDRVGPAVAMAVGTLCGISPVVLQLMWTSTFPAFIGTMGGLSFSYMLFGFAASFYNVIGCFAPLEGFPKKDIGKVSAVVQVCLSLGLTVQTWAYTMLKQSGGDYMGKSASCRRWKGRWGESSLKPPPPTPPKRPGRLRTGGDPPPTQHPHTTQPQAAQERADLPSGACR